MEDREEFYHYHAIESKNQIRVLRLEPGAFAEPLIGSLLVRKVGVDKVNPPAYDGVSYCWGPPNNVTSFVCDGKALCITAVVDEMLRHLRKSKKPRYLWIDAICINQDDLPEKNQQVRLMGRIYALARKVRVWLGPATDEELDAIHPVFDSSDLDEDDLWKIIQKRYCQPTSDVSTSAMASMREFFSRAWFTRRWVLQEVALSSEAVVHCGADEISWNQFHERVDALWWAYRSAHGADATTRTLDNIVMLKTFGKDALEDPGTTSIDKSRVYMSILDLMQTYHITMCADERDRVYSLYGLLPGATIQDDERSAWVLPCPVDYNLHFSQTYTSLASACVKAGLSHKILVHALEFGGLAHQGEGWPSWVPSWNMTRKLTNVGNFFRYLRPSQSLADDRLLGPWRSTAERLWREDDPDITDVYGVKAVHLNGCLHCIRHTQSSKSKPDAISYFVTILQRQWSRGMSDMYRRSMAWVLALAMHSIPAVYSRPTFDIESALINQTSRVPGFTSLDPEQLLWIAAKRVFGLQSHDNDGALVDLDMPKFISEAKRILEGYDAFSYEYKGSLQFGIAFGDVKPGDFVFRTTRAICAKYWDVPSAFGLILRPCYSPSSTGAAAFRLVGMCADCYPDNEDPEIVKVVLV